jgi:uncharacterized protein (TIGR02145 family)
MKNNKIFLPSILFHRAGIFKLVEIFMLIMLAGSCENEVRIDMVINTSATSNITSSAATSGGNISYDAGYTVTVRGVCWSTKPAPTVADNKSINGNGNGSFGSALFNLKPNTTYYVRAYATIDVGTFYGNQIEFKTTMGSVTDIDGNVYDTVHIGTQIWLKQNLKVTRYRNGDSIPNIGHGWFWYTLTSGAYCDYGNIPENSLIYGRLYNWYAVNDSSNIAPVGWHVPTKDEWMVLIDYLGGLYSLAGGKLKETGNAHWIEPNFAATNETGFTALPGGARVQTYFSGIGSMGYWWSSTGVENNPNNLAYYYNINYMVGAAFPETTYRYNGYSVRCIKDN